MPRLLRSSALIARFARLNTSSHASIASLPARAEVTRAIEAGPSTFTPPSCSSSNLSSLLRANSRSTSLFSRSAAPTSLLSSSTSFSSTRLFLSSLLASQSTQIRGISYGAEYQPSQRVRKRRHGFLARRRSKGGRKVLIRRRMKGRRFLSH